MTQIDHLTSSKNPETLQAKLQQFLSTLSNLTDRHTQSLALPIFDLTLDEQQQIVDKLNPYISFELAQNPELKNIPLKITGDGLMLVCDEAGLILGGETISHGDEIVGLLDDACTLPVPTVECLVLSDGIETPIIDQTLSPVIMLKNAVYKTGLSNNGEFGITHDLEVFQIGIPLAHYLAINAVNENPTAQRLDS